jgi:DNA-binding IclR family transcriptional regulator
MRRLQKPELARSREDEQRWSLLTAHALVLLCIARNPETRVREIAEDVGISERGAHQIVADLVGAGYVRRARIGRRNRYSIEEKTSLKHGPVRHRRVASIIALLGPEPAKSAAPRVRRDSPSRRVTANGTVKVAKRRAA